MRAPRRTTSPWPIAFAATLLLALSQAGMFEVKAQTQQGEAKAKAIAVKAVPKPVKLLDSSIEQVRVVRNGEQTEVRIEGSGPLYCVPFLLTRPDRLVLDFLGAAMRAQRPMIQGNVRPVRSVRFSQFKPVVARVVIDLDGQAPYLLTAKEAFVTVVFGSPAAAIPVVAVENVKKSSVLGASGPVTPEPPPGLFAQATNAFALCEGQKDLRAPEDAERIFRADPVQLQAGHQGLARYEFATPPRRHDRRPMRKAEIFVYWSHPKNQVTSTAAESLSSFYLRCLS